MSGNGNGNNGNGQGKRVVVHLGKKACQSLKFEPVKIEMGANGRKRVMKKNILTEADTARVEDLLRLILAAMAAPGEKENGARP